MQVIYKIALVFLGVFMIGCFSSDDSIYENNIQVEVLDAFLVDNKQNYSVGDTIYFDQKFSRYVKEEGYSDLLDIYETTNDTAFGYSFELEQYSEFSDSYRSVFIQEEFLLVNNIDLDYYSYYGTEVTAVLNDAQDAYESRVGIILPETGVYRLNFENIYFRNGYGYDNEVIHLDILHRFSDSATVALDFTVTE